MTPKPTLIVVSSLLVAAGPARAGIVEVGPFVGALTESWETFPTSAPEGDYLPSPTSIFGGAAAISNSFMAIYEPGVNDNSLGTSGSAMVADGDKGMGIQLLAQSATIEFIDPILDFGAFWGAATSGNVNVGDPAIIEVDFFAENDVFIATQVFEYSRSMESDGLLEWHGWSSSIPIEKITYTEDRVAIDGLQANLVPEPSIIWLSALLVYNALKRDRAIRRA